MQSTNIFFKKKKEFVFIRTVQRLDGTMLLLPIGFEQSSVEHTTKVTCRLQQSVLVSIIHYR